MVGASAWGVSGAAQEASGQRAPSSAAKTEADRVCSAWIASAKVIRWVEPNTTAWARH